MKHVLMSTAHDTLQQAVHALCWALLNSNGCNPSMQAYSATDVAEIPPGAKGPAQLPLDAD